MFRFLGDASAAYTKHFSQELQEASVRCNVDGPLSVLGPAVIIFHETYNNNVLSKGKYLFLNYYIDVQKLRFGNKCKFFVMRV